MKQFFKLRRQNINSAICSLAYLALLVIAQTRYASWRQLWCSWWLGKSVFQRPWDYYFD